MTKVTKADALRQYWADVRAGRREPPKRTTDGTVTRTLSIALDGTFGPDRGKRLVVTLRPDGRQERAEKRLFRAE